MPKIIGHRGAMGEEPENTLLGIRKALEYVDGAEIDVHLTKDKKFIVMHDDTVNRTTNGKGKVRDFTAKEIRELDAGKGEKVPFLQEVIGIVKQSSAMLFIELKCDNAEELLAKEVMDSGIMDRIVVKSFDHRRMKRIKEICPKMVTDCLLVSRPIDIVSILNNAKADMLSINYKSADSDLIADCHRAGKSVFVWNIDTLEEMKLFKMFGADYIGTNYPSKINGKS
ncbi:hypothetical protein J4401_02790 [Candidatus Woesearchaeota archaeon]|nr:hypothetical protein [Candidatus Woesearchaeota archaeon]